VYLETHFLCAPGWQLFEPGFVFFLLSRQAKEVAQLYKQLVRDLAEGKVGLQQAQSDLCFAAEAAAAVEGIWKSKKVTAAVDAARLPVNQQMLMPRHSVAVS
jgi:hypothetical protein